MTNEIYQRVQLNRFKNQTRSKQEIDKITKSNLVQLCIWADETKVTFENGRFKPSRNDKYVIYDHFIYNHYTGELLPPIYALEFLFGFDFCQSAYLLNYFYYKVNKTEIEDFIIANYKHSSSTMIVDGDADLDYIINQDGFISSRSHYCYTRAIAYLCNNRRIDNDICTKFYQAGIFKNG